MVKLESTIVLYNEYEKYYQYKSQEEENGRPIIDGVYIQREIIGENPPQKMKLLLEWE
jgi:hypothetical protein